MRRAGTYFGSMFVVASLLAGCDRAAPPASAPPAAGKPKVNPDVKLRLVTFEEIFQHIEANKGKVVVLDVWSTSCAPCKEEYHNLVELHNEYPQDQLACLSLSLDYYGVGKPEDLEGKVMEFLQEQGSTLTNLMSRDDADEVSKKMNDLALPTVLVYDKEGRLRKQFDNKKAKKKDEQFTYAQVRELVAELIKEPMQ